MKKLLLLPLFFTLTACSTLPSTFSSTAGTYSGAHYLSWKQRQAQVAALQNWTAQGSIAAQNNRKGWNASYSWEQEGEAYTLQLFGPLGMNHVQLSGNSKQVILKTAQHIYSAASPEALLQQQAGWTLPVSNLLYWLRGSPAPHAPFKRSLNPSNHMVQLYQAGWRILYLQYDSVHGIDLPTQMLLSNPQWHIRIVVNHWQV